jgi:malic enzyme
MPKVTDQEARDYHHLNGKPGKIAVVPTKPMDTQRDLGLAYTPGVAVPGIGSSVSSIMPDFINPAQPCPAMRFRSKTWRP